MPATPASSRSCRSRRSTPCVAHARPLAQRVRAAPRCIPRSSRTWGGLATPSRSQLPPVIKTPAGVVRGSLPPRIVRGWNRLKHFVGVFMRNANGRVAELSDLLPGQLPSCQMRLPTVSRRRCTGLNFAAMVWIGDNGPLDIEGFRSIESGTMKAYQYCCKNRELVGKARVGSQRRSRAPSPERPSPGRSCLAAIGSSKCELADCAGSRHIGRGSGTLWRNRSVTHAPEPGLANGDRMPSPAAPKSDTKFRTVSYA